MPRNERGLERVGQHDGAVVGGKRFREAPPRGEPELAVPERQRDGVGHLGHAAIDRQHPRRREHVDDSLRVALLQPDDERMRDNRVTDPRRGYDECPWHRVEKAA